MATTTPGRARTVYKRALAEAEQEVQTLNADQQRITVRLAKLEPVIYALQCQLNPGWSNARNLTDAVRQVIKFSARPLLSQDVCGALKKQGKLRYHSHPLASVCSLLSRLVKSEEVIRINKGSKGDPYGYWWAANGAPPPTK